MSLLEESSVSSITEIDDETLSIKEAVQDLKGQYDNAHDTKHISSPFESSNTPIDSANIRSLSSNDENSFKALDNLVFASNAQSTIEPVMTGNNTVIDHFAQLSSAQSLPDDLGIDALDNLLSTEPDILAITDEIIGNPNIDPMDIDIKEFLLQSDQKQRLSEIIENHSYDKSAAKLLEFIDQLNLPDASDYMDKIDSITQNVFQLFNLKKSLQDCLPSESRPLQNQLYNLYHNTLNYVSANFPAPLKEFIQEEYITNQLNHLGITPLLKFEKRELSIKEKMIEATLDTLEFFGLKKYFV